MTADLSAYHYLKFSASGQGNVRIRLMKKSVIDFNKQYEYLLPLTGELKEYVIKTEDFKSSGTGDPIKMNDLVIVSFTYEASAPATSINAMLRNVRFADKVAVPELTGNKIHVYPNPARTNITLNLKSSYTEKMQVQLISTGSGQRVFEKQLSITEGINTINLELPLLPSGLYFLSVRSEKQRYQNKILIQ